MCAIASRASRGHPKCAYWHQTPRLVAITAALSVWLYTTYAGIRLALDNAPGPLIIDAGGKLFITQDGDGSQAHHCPRGARGEGPTDVVNDEFLLP
jgi:hypothetical protein